MPPENTITLYPPRPLFGELLPESDGKPIAESDTHRDQLFDLLNCLDDHFRDNPNVYITGNLFLHYLDENKQRKSITPDIFVVFGVEKKLRRYYQLDLEGKAPDVVIELTSNETQMEDFGDKREIYTWIGVREYFVFDPLEDYLQPPLHGFRLDGNEYRPMMGARLHSEALGLDLVGEQGRLRLYDPKTGRFLLTHEESEAARRSAEAKAAAAEEENARLREELAKRRGATA
jgi:Uma2 family endonuclease